MLLLPIMAGIFGVTLKVGDKAPDFTITDTDNKSHTLSKAVTEGPVILAFFPKAFTSG